MTAREIRKRLKEQPTSYLQDKDINKFDTIDFHCLRKGILCNLKKKPKKR